MWEKRCGKIEYCEECTYSDCVLNGIEVTQRCTAEQAKESLRRVGVKAPILKAEELWKQYQQEHKKPKKKKTVKLKMTQEEYDEINKRHTAGETYTQIAQSFGVSRYALRGRIKRFEATNDGGVREGKSTGKEGCTADAVAG